MEIREFDAEGLKRLKEEYIATSPLEQTPAMRVRLAVEIIKEGVMSGQFPLDSARYFASTLRDYCVQPVTIGTERQPVFSAIEVAYVRVGQIRNLMDQIKGVPGFSSASLLVQSQLMAEKVDRIMVRLEVKHLPDLLSRMGPFSEMLRGEDVVEDVAAQAQKEVTMQAILEGKEKSQWTQEEMDAVDSFWGVYFPNVYYGKQLEAWLEGLDK